MINMKVRFKNPVFVAQLILSVLMPILAYMGLSVNELTTWNTVGSVLACAVSNPYVLGMVIVSVWNAVNDPTTKGCSDSSDAMKYDKPKEG